jgi:hypothetical protein
MSHKLGAYSKKCLGLAGFEEKLLEEKRAATVRCAKTRYGFES